MAEQANYQGEHLGLSLNRDAVFALNDALEQLRFSVDDRASAAVPLRLPDGRTLQLRLSLTDAGEIRDANGEYLDDDGIAHGDVTGDLAAHADVRQVLDHVVRPSLMWDLSTAQREGSESVDVDALAATRAEAAVEALPFRYGRSQEWVAQLRDRALNFAREELPALLAEDRESLRRVRAARGDTSTLTGPLVAPTAAVGEERARPPAEPPAGRADDEGSASVEVDRTGAVELAPPARLRNRYDDERRSDNEAVRYRRKWAAEATADGRQAHAGYWAAQAREWEGFAADSRTRAIDEDRFERTADPDGYASRLAAARDASSDGRSAGVGMAM